MADKITKETRSENMKAIRSVSLLENKVTQALWNRGYRFRKNVKNMLGKPDIVIKKYKIVIFIDSCFWHYCPIHGTVPKSNTGFWTEKLERNKRRDGTVTTHYIEDGWNILRIWEHELRSDFTGTIEKIIKFIKMAESKKEKTP